MKKATKLVLVLGLVLLGALCYAHGASKTENEKEKGAPKIAIIKSHHAGTDKSGSIVPYINGHSLIVAFTENIGLVEMEITTATGELVQTLWVFSPDGLQTYIPQTGNYVITFTLSNGDEYYGEFTVSD